MAKNITRPKLQDVVIDAAASAIVAASKGEPITPAAAMKKAREVAGEVVTDGRIAPALVPVSRWNSETLRGIVIAAGAPLLVALGRLAGVEILEGDAATIVSTTISLAAAGYAWYGRETTTRPLA